jgi:hypothetical protein
MLTNLGEMMIKMRDGGGWMGTVFGCVTFHFWFLVGDKWRGYKNFCVEALSPVYLHKITVRLIL